MPEVSISFVSSRCAEAVCCPPVSCSILFPVHPVLAASWDHFAGACALCFRSCTSVDGSAGKAPISDLTPSACSWCPGAAGRVVMAVTNLQFLLSVVSTGFHFCHTMSPQKASSFWGNISENPSKKRTSKSQGSEIGFFFFFFWLSLSPYKPHYSMNKSLSFHILFPNPSIYPGQSQSELQRQASILMIVTV